MIALLRIHALLRAARVRVFIGRAAEYVRTASCRKAREAAGKLAASGNKGVLHAF